MGLQLYDLAGAEPKRRFSPYCWRIKLSLMHMGLAFDTIPRRFTDKDAIAFSGQGRVPVGRALMRHSFVGFDLCTGPRRVADGLGRLRVSAMKILFWHLTRASILNHGASRPIRARPLARGQ
jgi:hypothetical protein